MVLGQPLDTGVELLLIALAIPDVTQMSNELQGVQRVLLPSLYHTSRDHAFGLALRSQGWQSVGIILQLSEQQQCLIWSGWDYMLVWPLLQKVM